MSQFFISIFHIYHISPSMSVRTYLLLFPFLCRSPTNTFQEKITLVAKSSEMVQMKFWFFLKNKSLPNPFILSVIQEVAKSRWSLSRDICIQWPDSLTKVLEPGGGERGRKTQKPLRVGLSELNATRCLWMVGRVMGWTASLQSSYVEVLLPHSQCDSIWR